MSATLVSVRVGRVATLDRPDWDHAPERTWKSAYLKDEVAGPVRLTRLGLEGDEQYDKAFHGGEHMALLAYGAAHYPRWQEELGMPEFGPGALGENLTIAGLDESLVCIGDVYEMGEVHVQVSQPRGPCNHIARRWNRQDLLSRVVATGRTGWYLRVLEEGLVVRGAEVVLRERRHPRITVADVTRLGLAPESDPDAVVAIAACDALAPEWREKFAKLARRLERSRGE